MINNIFIIIVAICISGISIISFSKRKTIHDTLVVTEDIMKAVDPIIDTAGALTGNITLIEVGKSLDLVESALHKIEEDSFPEITDGLSNNHQTGN